MCEVHFTDRSGSTSSPKDTPCIRVVVAPEIWSSLQSHTSPFSNPTFRKFLIFAADIRDKILDTCLRGSIYKRFNKLTVSFNRSQPITVPVLTEIRPASLNGSYTNDKQLCISVAEGNLDYPRLIMSHVHKSIEFRLGRYLRFSYIIDNGNALIIDGETEDRHQLPRQLADLVDNILAGSNTTAESRNLSLAPPNPDLPFRASWLYRIIQERVSPASLDWANVNIDPDCFPGPLLKNLTDQLNHLSPEIIAALKLYIDKHQNLYGAEFYPHADRFMQLLAVKNCKLIPLLKQANTAAIRNLEATGETATTYGIQFIVGDDSLVQLVVLPEGSLTARAPDTYCVGIIISPALAIQLLSATDYSNKSISFFIKEIEQQLVSIERLIPNQSSSDMRILKSTGKTARREADSPTKSQPSWRKWLEGLGIPTIFKRLLSAFSFSERADGQRTLRLPDDLYRDLKERLGGCHFDGLYNPQLGDERSISFSADFYQFYPRPPQYRDLSLTISISEALINTTKLPAQEADVWEDVLSAAEAFRELAEEHLGGNSSEAEPFKLIFVFEPAAEPLSWMFDSRFINNTLTIRCSMRFVQMYINGDIKSGSGIRLANLSRHFSQALCGAIPTVLDYKDQSRYKIVSSPSQQMRTILRFDVLRLFKEMLHKLPPAPLTRPGLSSKLSDQPDRVLEDFLNAYKDRGFAPQAEASVAAIHRFGESAINELVDRLNTGAVSHTEFLYLIELFRNSPYGFLQIKDSVRLEYLFSLLGLTDIIDRFNQRAQTDNSHHNLRLMFHMVDRSREYRADGCTMYLGAVEDADYTVTVNGRPQTYTYQHLFIGLNKETLQKLLTATKLADIEDLTLIKDIRGLLDDLCAASPKNSS